MGITMTLSKITREQIKKHCNYKCVKCKNTKNLEVHHILPKSRKGKNVSENLDCLCNSCHKDWHNNQEDRYMILDDWEYVTEYFGWLGWDKTHIATWDVIDVVLEANKKCQE